MRKKMGTTTCRFAKMTSPGIPNPSWKRAPKVCKSLSICQFGIFSDFALYNEGEPLRCCIYLRSFFLLAQTSLNSTPAAELIKLSKMRISSRNLVSAWKAIIEHLELNISENLADWILAFSVSPMACHVPSTGPGGRWFHLWASGVAAGAMEGAEILMAKHEKCAQTLSIFIPKSIL